ncbi:MAG TPA: 2-oxo acid dehydrogenase subunit E2 [Bacilli bacterium]|nr:2-oxo acid dehydrogenase subunit E2 [Bacilli bacterium]
MSKDRRDAKYVKNISGMHKIMVFVKSKRCDEDVYIHEDVDVTNLVKYMEKAKKKDKNLTYFHLFATAIGKTIYFRPLMNRYIINNNYYDRYKITLGFVAKVAFEDHSDELMTKLDIEAEDNLKSVENKILEKVEQIRSNKKEGTDNLIETIGKMPKFMRKLVVKVIICMDKHDWLPQSIIDSLLYYSTIIVSNLGSIGCNAIYHNITDFGTNSILFTIGKIKKENYLDDDGKLQQRYLCDFGVNMDERIADGFYFAKSLQLFEDFLQNPEILEKSIDTELVKKE